MGAACAGAPPADAQGAAPGCNLSGSSGVIINGKPALRLGDVTACPGLRYEIVPGVMVDGQPMVRLLPSEDCAARGSENVLVDGAPAARQGDANCVGG